MEKFLKGLVEGVNKEEGTLTVAVATDTSVDRDGEIVDPAGLDTANFEKNPVLLYAHDYRSDPIGKVTSIKRDGNRILFVPQFAVNISARAKQYFEMYKEGFLNAFSIGFIPREWKDQDNGSGKINRVFTKTELLEISAVPVPANPNALVLARGYKGMTFDQEILSDMEKSLKTVTGEEAPKPEEKPEGEQAAEVEEPKPEAETPKPQEGMEEVKAAITSINETLSAIQKALADNGNEKALTVEELLRHGDFHRGVLRVVDKAFGLALQGMNKRDK